MSTHCSRGLSSGGTNLNANIRSRNEHLGDGYTSISDIDRSCSPVIGYERDSKQIANIWVIVLSSGLDSLLSNTRTTTLPTLTIKRMTSLAM